MWLLLHGFTGAPRSWDRVVAHAELDRTPLVPSLAGHGPDWQERDVESFEDEVTRLVSLAASLEAPRLLCGYSMGARVALGLLARKPDLFDAAVLIGVDPGLTEEAARVERRKVDARRARLLREEGIAAFVSAWEQEPLFASQRDLSQGALAAQRDVRLVHDAAGLARALEVLGLAEMPDYRSAMDSVEIPITLMAGALDSKFCGLANVLAKEKAHIVADIVEGVGHNVVLEAPTAVAVALKRTQDRVGG